MSKTKEAMDALFNGNAADFRSSIRDALADKTQTAVQDYRKELGANMFAVEEEVEDLDELSKGTVERYKNKTGDIALKKAMDAQSGKTKSKKDLDKDDKWFQKRMKGLSRAERMYGEKDD